MAHSESGTETSLGDSAYEFVDTDGEVESRNEVSEWPESVTSADRGGDVASLANDTESEDDSDQEDPYPSAATPPLEYSAELPATTPSISRASTILDVNHFTQSIEFEEPYNALNAETVAAKHTVIDLNEEETKHTAVRMNLARVPERMAITIRQTMTKQGLATREPLRILYVGSHIAKQDIIHKIASSVTASVDRKHSRDGHNTRSSPQLYNVVQVSAFGSEETPEIELMHSSGYQINVEDCFGAESMPFEDEPEKLAIIKLTLDDNVNYHSIPEGQGFIVEPQWELPHVTVVYCSDTDDREAKLTTSLVRQFMSRSNIPCIVISHKQLFDSNSPMALDQHPIHMCLESRDADTRGSVILRRLPIDLSSFLNIDARQMNRNLAFLTGLHEPPAPSNMTINVLPNPQETEKTFSITRECARFVRRWIGADWRTISVILVLISISSAILTGAPNYGAASKQAISVNSKVISAIPVSTPPSLVTPPVASITATATQVVINTSTKTVTVTQSPGPNSLSVVPSMEVGRLFQSPSSKPASKAPLCYAEVLGDREILIRIPSPTLLSWLNREALQVNITRGDDSVDTERAYSTGDGVVLLLPQTQAYGLLNVSIITTKKPKVNETFQVDFGTSLWQSMLDKYSTLFVEGKGYSSEEIVIRLEKFVQETRESSQSTLSKLTEIVTSTASDAAKLRSTLTKDISAHLVEAESAVANNLQSLKDLKEPLGKAILTAQIRSKLLWLKLQGKRDEYESYKNRAAKATGAPTAEMRDGRKNGPRRQKIAVKKAGRRARGRGEKHD